MAAQGDEVESVKLSQAASYLLDECRMVLPGVQATFGFQLMAVFNDRFAEDLQPLEQHVHFASLTLVALAAALVMAPAAYHRLTDITHVTRAFIDLSSRFMMASMAVLAVGLALDFYVVGKLVFGHDGVAAFAAAMFALMASLWFVFPRLSRRPAC